MVLGATVSLAACSMTPGEHSVTSPNGELKVVFECEEGKLYYHLDLSGRKLLARSSISILKDVGYEIEDGSVVQVDETWHPVWGQFSTIYDRCNELTLNLRVNGQGLSLICRAYDDGIGFRFLLPEPSQPEGKTVELATEFLFDADYQMYHPRGENEPKGPIALSSFDPEDRGDPIPAFVKMGRDLPSALIPAVIELEDDLYLAILESDLYSAVGMAETSAMNLVPSEGPQPGLISVNSAKITADDYLTPWRVVLVGRQAGDLAVNTVPLNLAAQCQIEDTSWIQPGKCVWDWRLRGYRTDGFTYGADTASFKRLIDFASENNIRYLLIDWHWYWVRDEEFVVSSKIRIKEVTGYARDKGVGVILYWDEWRGGPLPMEEVYEIYSDFGAAGIKYGFRQNDAVFTEEAIRRAAEHHLVIDFHDLVCPMVGVRRTLPNALTREYAHAQLDAGKVSSPTTFLKMVMINMITGPLDMNHGFYALNTDPETTSRIGWGLTLDSTVASENARALICFSGLVIFPDAPEEYEKKKDLFEFLAQMPQATWDETRVLHSQLAKHISLARRSGDEWFVGSAIDEKGDSLDLELDFLKDGITYDATFYEDAEDSHYQTNKEAYRVRTSKVKKNDVVTAVMAPGGGHSIWIRPE